MFSLKSTNDYISPSPECVKPVQIDQVNTGDAKVTIEIDDTGNYYQVSKDGSKEHLKKAQITLNDCLACSGCITSAESVLIQMQTKLELYKALETKKYVIVSVSPQTVASFAKKYNLDMQTAFKRIYYFLAEKLKVEKVMETSFGRDLSLIQSCKSFISNFNKKIPLITGICPGWVCYAEKTQPFLIDWIDPTKSPQQMMGTLVKLKYPDAFHATIMPCYDKKLEASREDLKNQVDCVITTVELEQMMSDLNFDFGVDITLQLPVDLSSDWDKLGEFSRFKDGLIGSLGTSSGGYTEYVLKYAAQHLFSMNDLKDFKIRQIRNDYIEYTLIGDQGEKLLTFVQCFGFRNIQNLVRKLKTGKEKVDFIEIMACPSGCINGGGQLKPPNSVWSAQSNSSGTRDWISEAERLYQSIEPKQAPEHNSLAIQLYNQLYNADPSSLVTSYKALEKETGLMVKW